MRFIIILLTFIGVVFAIPQRKMRIVGGTPTTIDQYPYMCNMQYLWGGTTWAQACGGSLLTTRTVLSAAHCYYGDSAVSWRVRVGTSYASSGGTVIQVSQLVIHDLYDSNIFDNDVAIIRLSTAAVLSRTVAVASIAGPYYNLPDGTTVQSIGWGALVAGGGAPEQLQHVDINTINQQLCADRYAYLKSQPGYSSWPDVTAGMLCAGVLDEGGRDACQGDSGGPVIYSRNIIIGLTSWGFGCAHEFYPGVNVRVSYYSNWITLNASN